MSSVSVIVPCYNEETTIHLLLDALYKQTYRHDEFEIIIADGMSTDRTKEKIQEFQMNCPDMRIRVIDNPNRTIPSGLNRAIEAARGEFIIRLDAHSVPQPEYISCCVSDLERSLGANVGGVWEIQARNSGWQAESIALAAGHPFGVGDARYRYSNRAGPVDTVPFGAFRKSLVEQIGNFNEDLLTNEDYEFNTRIRNAGGVVWFDPEIRSVYFARSSLVSLARQYWRYGYWKVRMLQKYPKTIRWRQALPPIFTAGLIILAVIAIFVPIARWALMLYLGLYGLLLGVVGFQLAIKHRDPRVAVGVPLAILTMHLSWGSAFLWSLFHKPWQ